MQLHFTASESTFSYFEATRAYLERHGKPVAFYSDKASVFRKTSADKTGDSVTHFGRAMCELNIDTFCANSSPAKGRVERAHLTLQDRLVKALRLRGISTIEVANAYAGHFNLALTRKTNRRLPSWCGGCSLTLKNKNPGDTKCRPGFAGFLRNTLDVLTCFRSSPDQNPSTRPASRPP